MTYYPPKTTAVEPELESGPRKFKAQERYVVWRFIEHCRNRRKTKTETVSELEKAGLRYSNGDKLDLIYVEYVLPQLPPPIDVFEVSPPAKIIEKTIEKLPFTLEVILADKMLSSDRKVEFVNEYVKGLK